MIDPQAVQEFISISTHRNSPLFITGAPRSGTSWIGERLGEARGVRYVYEPFNPKWSPELVGELSHFDYLSAKSNGSVALEVKIDRAFSGRQSRKQLLRAAYRRYLWLSIRPFDRVIVKDPTAVLMADWISERYHARVLVIMRHPCAFVSSIIGLGWRLSNQRFLLQRQLMSDYLCPYESIISQADTDPLVRAAAVWCVIHIVLLAQLEHHPDWVLVKYEDLCVDDGAELAKLANKLGLELNSDASPAEPHKPNRMESDSGSTNKISRDMPEVWKKRLTSAQIATVQGVVHDFGLDHLYPEGP